MYIQLKNSFSQNSHFIFHCIPHMLTHFRAHTPVWLLFVFYRKSGHNGHKRVEAYEKRWNSAIFTAFTLATDWPLIGHSGHRLAMEPTWIVTFVCLKAKKKGHPVLGCPTVRIGATLIMASRQAVTARGRHAVGPRLDESSGPALGW